MSLELNISLATPSVADVNVLDGTLFCRIKERLGLMRCLSPTHAEDSIQFVTWILTPVWTESSGILTMVDTDDEFDNDRVCSILQGWLSLLVMLADSSSMLRQLHRSGERDAEEVG